MRTKEAKELLRAVVGLSKAITKIEHEIAENWTNTGDGYHYGKVYEGAYDAVSVVEDIVYRAVGDEGYWAIRAELDED